MLFLFLILVSYSSCEIKLLKFYGEVTGLYGNVSEHCLHDCYFMDDCILVYFHEVCEVYSYIADLNVTRTWSGSLVYFKVTVPDKACPLSSSNLTLTTGDSYTWKTSPGGWVFPGCRDGWTRFDRSNNISVYIKGFNFGKRKRDRAYDISYCKNLNSVLVGVDTVAEAKWMKTILLGFYNYNEPSFFWISGEHNCTGNDKCNNYTWLDGFTTGNSAITKENADMSFKNTDQKPEPCLVIANYYRNGISMNDVMCGSAYSGTFCGYRLY